MATTTNYGWTTPDDTSLVKDGAAAIRTLGSSVDTTTKALNPSTTLGDIEYRSATANTNTRLGIGTTGQVLTVNGGVPSWQTASSGGMTVIASGSLSGAAVNLTSIPTTYVGLQLHMQGVSLTVSDQISLRVNNDASGSYPRIFDRIGSLGSSSSTASLVSLTGDNTLDTNTNASFVVDFPNYAVTTGWKVITANTIWFQSSSVNNVTRYGGGYVSNTAITQLNILAAAGSFDSGTYTLYGVK